MEPAILAALLMSVATFVLFVPYIAVRYRRRGELSPGNVALAFAGPLYGLALFFYVFAPFPPVRPDFCAAIGVRRPQLVPFHFLHDMGKSATGSSPMAVLNNPALTQVLLNVALFVPLGILVRYMFGRSVPVTAAIGLGVSLLIETTQLTGDWFIYPCPYRLFDVDDLIANGLGGVIGALAAPLLSAVPGQRVHAEPEAPRPITWRRRLLASVCDLMSFAFLYMPTVAAGAALMWIRQGGLSAGGTPAHSYFSFYSTVERVGFWVPWLVLTVGIPLVGSGASLGQRIVKLEAATADGRRPDVKARLLRAVTGVGGFLLLNHFESLTGLAVVLAGVSLIALFKTSRHRGFSYLCARLTMTDSRTSAGQAVPTDLVH
ncbi:VanZ family protein [Streptomyces sp. WI04-05B]|uniref:VanZ family protein n=1 Tax=Streptomyces TaxID=1883 RepID=UPI0029B23517|nr:MULTISPECIES: VanZ family protein [unclassified Streptomyces]MDX2548964.1 VanZ family protein [Streptomyces sp. WI04-05B]MDX2589274.1 VanZ family protein [Streptomyces sp. WI04-05A]